MSTTEIISFISEFGINKSKLARDIGVPIYNLHQQLIPYESEKKTTRMQPDVKVKLTAYIENMKQKIMTL